MDRNINLHDEHCYTGQVVIFGIDPGVTTGVSVISYPKREKEVPMPDMIRNWGSTQLSYGGSGNSADVILPNDGAEEQEVAYLVSLMIRRALKYPSAEVHVAIEDFIVRRMDQSRDFLSPVRITAGILQELYPMDVSIYMQSPSEAKQTCTDERMDRWGYTIKTQKDRHSRDADRHAVTLLRKGLSNPRLFNH